MVSSFLASSAKASIGIDVRPRLVDESGRLHVGRRSVERGTRRSTLVDESAPLQGAVGGLAGASQPGPPQPGDRREPADDLLPESWEAMDELERVGDQLTGRASWVIARGSRRSEDARANSAALAERPGHLASRRGRRDRRREQVEPAVARWACVAQWPVEPRIRFGREHRSDPGWPQRCSSRGVETGDRLTDNGRARHWWTRGIAHAAHRLMGLRADHGCDRSLRAARLLGPDPSTRDTRVAEFRAVGSAATLR